MFQPNYCKFYGELARERQILGSSPGLDIFLTQLYIQDLRALNPILTSIFARTDVFLLKKLSKDQRHHNLNPETKIAILLACVIKILYNTT